MNTESKHLKVLFNEHENLPSSVTQAAKDIFKAEVALREVVDKHFKIIGEYLNYDDGGDLIKETWQEAHIEYDSEDQAVTCMVEDIAFEIWELRKIQAEESLKELGSKGDHA